MAFVGARIARRLRRHSTRGIVLCYHRIAGLLLDPAMLAVPPALFDGHMAALRRYASPLPLAEFDRRRRAGQLPERAVAVTFDDGYADNLHAALPILEVHGVPGAVFVTTSGVDSPTEFWWDALERACYVQHALPGQVDVGTSGERFHWTLDARACAPRDATSLCADDGRRSLYSALSAWLRVRSAAVRSAIVAQLQVWSDTPATPRESHRQLRVDELQVLARSPLVEIGSHTVTHPALGLMDATGQREECVASRMALQHWLGIAPTFFAYPFGDGTSVTKDAQAAVRGAGYAAGFTTASRAAWRWNRPMLVPRFAMQAWDGAEFARRLDRWFEE